MARARALHLLADDEPLTPAVRRQVAKLIFDEQSTPEAPEALPDISLLSRATHPVDGGIIRIDVLFIPTTKETSHV